MRQETYTQCIRPIAAAMAKGHVAVHRISGGRVGRRWRGGQVALLSTVGRHSGLRRTTPLVCIEDGRDIVVVASNGGSDRTPDWWLNLQHRPYAELEVAGRVHPVVAEPAVADTYIRLVERFCDAFPCLAAYRLRTERELPVVVLHPLP